MNKKEGKHCYNCKHVKGGCHLIDKCEKVSHWKPEEDDIDNMFSEEDALEVTFEATKKDIPISTQEKIVILFNNFEEFLIEKNKRYGDSALSPLNIFSKQSSSSQICNRIDDKISRIKESDTLKKNDLSDLFGYIALLLIENEWIEFDDLLD